VCVCVCAYGEILPEVKRHRPPFQTPCLAAEWVLIRLPFQYPLIPTHVGKVMFCDMIVKREEEKTNTFPGTCHGPLLSQCVHLC